MLFKKSRLILIIFLLLLFICIGIFAFNIKITTNKNSSLKVEGIKHDILIGTAVNVDALNNDAEYKKKIREEFSIITPENEMKFSVVQPKFNEFTFDNADRIVEFAEKNEIKVRGHTLVWDKRIPDWLKNSNFTKEEAEQILKNHIYTVVNRYKGRIYAWDVVNEAFNNDGSLKDSYWLRTIGPEYIKKSFIWAKEADPNALLFYNDYSAEVTNEKSNAIFNLLKSLKNEEIPVDGIGFQFHTSLYQKFTEKEITTNMERFRDIGLKINVTELDVKISDSNYSENLKLKKQAEQYSVVLDSCKNLKGSCSVFSMWGFTDKYTWLRNDRPLLFNNEYEEKPSYNALKNILSK